MYPPTPQGPERELDRYLTNGDATFRWSSATRGRLWFQSQTWKGGAWTHDLSLCESPEGGEHAILVVTGGDLNDLDEAEASTLSQLSGLPVATLYNIPNQPLFMDLWEDDLIAFTFIRYLATGEADWPLLFPMTKAVLRAMDALQEFTGGRLRKFIVTGLSKRGWTSWLAGASRDPRIAAIAPMVIDHLNIPLQMDHQMKTWGFYSEQIEAYTSLELPKALDSPEGMHLNSMVDPYSYRDRYACPLLIVNGANDRYWQVDALAKYWADLPQPKWCSVIPNVEHILGDKSMNLNILAGFSRIVSRGVPIATPTWIWSHDMVDSRVRFDSFSAMKQAQVWKATSVNYDFRDSVWQPMAGLETSRETDCFTALLGELQCEFEGIPFSLSTPVEVLRPSQA